LDVEIRQSKDENEELAKGDLADGDRIANDIENEFEVRINLITLCPAFPKPIITNAI
jgi:hypothetical protein